MENYDIAQNLRMKREALGYSRKKVCELCNYVFSEKTLYRMETGLADMSRHTIKELLKLYHQVSHTACAAMDMESYTVYRMYNEILVLMFQREYKEAERKLELFETYVAENSNPGRTFLNALKREVKCLTTDESVRENENFEFFEDTLKQMAPEGADISKWPFTDAELNTYLTYFNMLFLAKRYDSMIPLLEQLLENIEQGYLNFDLYSRFLSGFAYRLADALLNTNQYKRANDLVESATKELIAYGDMSGLYMLKNCLIRYIERKNFFDDEVLKEQCFQEVKRLYYLSLACNDTWYINFFEKRLKEIYHNIET